jgi:hypothetical protein
MFKGVVDDDSREKSSMGDSLIVFFIDLGTCR